MAKKQTKTRSTANKRITKKQETDNSYFLKLVMYFIFGTFWVYITGPEWIIPLPIGFIIGMAFAAHDHFKIDRKIEYAVLVVAMFISYFLDHRLTIAF